MSARKRHSHKLDFLRMIGEGTVASHCLGGANVRMLERLEKQGFVTRSRHSYAIGWGSFQANARDLKPYSIKRTRWQLTPKAVALLKKLDGGRLAPMRIHSGGIGYGATHRCYRGGYRDHRINNDHGRSYDERKLNAEHRHERENLVNPKPETDDGESVW
jgi:hypothetical protein